MSEISNNIVSLIVSKEFHKAKMLIHEMMNNKLGILLEEKLLEYAPTLYERTDEPLQLSVSREVDLDSPVDNITTSGSDATHSDSINVSHSPAKFSNGSAARAMGIRRNLGSSAPWTQDQIDQITGIPSPDEESPVADRVYDMGADAANVAQAAWLAQKTGVLVGLGRVLPGVNKLPIAKAIYPAFVAGQAVMTAADIAANPDWENDKAKATGDAANQVAHTGMRMAAFGNPVTGVLSGIDQIINDGRVTDWVTDTIIKHGNIVADPIASVVADTIVGRGKSSQDLKAARDLRRRGVTQQDIEKPPVAAGTVRNGSGQIMQQ